MNHSATTLGKATRAFKRCLRLAAREPRSALLLSRMACWVVALTLASRLLPLPRLIRLTKPLLRRKTLENSDEAQASLALLLDRLLAADVFVFTPTCWKRAPVLYRFLALRGIETRVVFGMRKGGGGGVDGHAWLESKGRPILEPHAPNFAVTFSFPPQASPVDFEPLGEGRVSRG